MVYDGVDPELIAVINQRMDLLRTLLEPRDKRELVAELDLSRSTVNRAVRQLESLGLVTRDGEYRLTVAGRLVVEVFEDVADRLGDVVRIEGLLSVLPADAPMGLPLVLDADVHWSRGPVPTEPLGAALDHLEEGTDIRLLVPRISRPDVVEVIEARAGERDVSVSVVVSRSLADHLRAADRNWLQSVDECDGAEVRVTEQLPYALGVVRKPAGLHAGVVVYDADGNLRGFVENDTLEAYAWADLVFDRYYDAAAPLGR